MKNLMHLINNEAKAFDQIQVLRAEFSPELFGEVSVNSKRDAMDRGQSIVHEILKKYENFGLDLNKIGPGHGIGHIIRDYTNALSLLTKLDADPEHLFVGFIGGVMHDLGCSIIERYTESSRAIRHAEAGALLLNYVFDNTQIDLNSAEKILIAYSVVAHTQYLRASDIYCSDRIVRHVEPYTDLDKDGKPLLGIWLTRWVDRLDCSGSAFVGRHYLTLEKVHNDFDGKTFFNIVFREHLQPLLRTSKSNGSSKTMVEHLKMFADSQNNSSPYGEHDFGKMIELRDYQKESLYAIIKSTQQELNFSPEEEENILAAWKLFLIKNIEPTALAADSASNLERMFKSLDNKARYSWCNGFLTTMKEYIKWAKENIKQITQLTTTQRYLPAIIDNIEKVIAPNKEWVELIY